MIKRVSLKQVQLSILIILAGVCFSSCQDNSICDPTAQPSLKLSFYGHKRYIRPFVDSPINVLVSSVYALNALRKDSSLIPQDSVQDTIHRSGLTLPVSHKDSSSAYVIVVNSNPGGIGNHFTKDTLRISYSKRLVFISQGCGYGYSYSLNKESITSHFFSVIKLPLSSPLIAPNVPENFRILINN